MQNRLTRRRLLLLAPLFLVAGRSAATAAQLPADLDFSLRRVTDNETCIATIAPSLSPIVIGKLHSWTVTLTTPRGKPVQHAEISITGGMPQHGHGLPTRPQVTGEPAPGRYLIEGMKFNMRGWWTLTLTIQGSAGPDSVTFNLKL
jgi:hypothetical protein